MSGPGRFRFRTGLSHRTRKTWYHAKACCRPVFDPSIHPDHCYVDFLKIYTACSCSVYIPFPTIALRQNLLVRQLIPLGTSLKIGSCFYKIWGNVEFWCVHWNRTNWHVGVMYIHTKQIFTSPKTTRNVHGQSFTMNKNLTLFEVDHIFDVDGVSWFVNMSFIILFFIKKIRKLEILKKGLLKLKLHLL